MSYYHILIKLKEKDKHGYNKTCYELDKTDLSYIENKIVEPYIKKEEFYIGGYLLSFKDISKIIISKTDITSKNYYEIKNDELLGSCIVVPISSYQITEDEKYSKNITEELFFKIKENMSTQDKDVSKIQNLQKNIISKNEIFIVHGHDNELKETIARFIEKLNLKPIILHEQPNKSLTIIEKIEKHSNVAFAIILLTPDDIGSSVSKQDKQQNRARQNVILELGYFLGKLGRENVVALKKGNIELPTDFSGILYIDMSNSNWKFELAKEMETAGLDIDMNKAL